MPRASRVDRLPLGPALLAAALLGCLPLGACSSGRSSAPSGRSPSPGASSAAPSGVPGSPPSLSAGAVATASPGASGAASPGFEEPVTVFELAEPVVKYQQYVTAQLDLLARQTAGLARDTDGGDLAAARRDWLAAHLTYRRLGAAYGAFGDRGTAIDRLDHGLPGGVADPAFTGFHRVEHELWSGSGSTARAAGPATRLAADVAALRTDAATLDIPVNTFTTRAHEILENTLQDVLTGHDDYGSGTGLATAAADLAGTRTVVGLLRPVLERRAPGLPARIDRALDAVDGALRAVPGARDGAGPSVTALPRGPRERLDAAVGAALETLAAVPGLLEVEDEDD